MRSVKVQVATVAMRVEFPDDPDNDAPTVHQLLGEVRVGVGNELVFPEHAVYFRFLVEEGDHWGVEDLQLRLVGPGNQVASAPIETGAIDFRRGLGDQITTVDVAWMIERRRYPSPGTYRYDLLRAGKVIARAPFAIVYVEER